MTLRTLLTFGAAMLAGPLAAQDATGDAASGEALFARQCASCHVVADAAGTVLAGRAAQTGPNLHGVVGATPGTREGFRYSDALIAYGETGVVWGEDNFVAFVQDPNGHLREALGDPSARSKMAFRLRDEQQARDIHAFLAQFATEAPETAAEGEPAAGGEAAEGAGADGAAEGGAAEGGAAGDQAAEGGAGSDGVTGEVTGGASEEGAVLAADLEAGEALYQESCRNCHGPTGRGMASFPRLSGLGAEHILTRLRQYHAGEEVGPNSALMIDVAADLSEADMANVAAYIGSAFE